MLYAESSSPLSAYGALALILLSVFKVYAHPEHADALAEVYTETTRRAQGEPGIVYYCICRDDDDPTLFHFFERYTGKKAFDEHNSQPIIQKLINEDKYIKDIKATFAKALGPFQMEAK